MSDFTLIEQKLQQFSRKYYTNELIKGSILFLAFGLLYLLFTVFIEYFLWLKPTARTILFWLFVGIELFLVVRFIWFPIFKLFGLQKGISSEEASKIIGSHFPEVQDKLLNVLQLQHSNQHSDLLLASIEQKSNELQPIPFTKAVDFKTNTKYIKYAFIPIFIWLITLFTGANTKLNQSFQRVVNHRVAYTPPAPFILSLTNNNLEVIQGKPLTIYVEAVGEVVPQEAKIFYNNQQYFIENNGAGLFSYTFEEVNESINFYVEANTIQSIDYQINIIKIPAIQNVSMQLIYPRYLGKKSEILPNTGNITVPQGTTIKWNVATTQTDKVSFISDEKREDFISKEANSFEFTKRILHNANYQITTSNNKLEDYEQLQFSVDVIKDEFPQIEVKSNIDSVSRGSAYFAGQISDDYGLQKLQLVYYNSENTQNQQVKSISITKEAVQSFFYEFPDGLELKDGVNYEMFFQVFDNDAINGNKKATSRKFSYRQKTNQEVEEELLEEQRDYIQNLQNSLEKQQKSKEDLEKIQFNIQNKKNMNWNDQKKVENLIKRQQQYKQMMQRQTEQLQENFSEKKEETESLQEKKEELQKRIEELKNLEKQQKLLDELMKMAEKLNKEDLLQKAKELAQQNKQQERSLERILELTKRFYVEQKNNQLANKLDELAKKQEELANKNSTEQEQKEVNKEFNQLKKDLQELQKDNQKLQDPMQIPEMKDLQYQTQEELNKAEQNLQQNQEQNAKQNQQKAAKKMQQMSQQMQQSMQMMSDEMAEENMEDMRKILENLLTFSFDQEALMEKFSGLSSSHPDFGDNLKKQYLLKSYFEHIDDSLFVLSMRVPKISSEIQDHLATAHYNLDQSLENFAESRFRNGISNQNYVMTSANTLADMLSNTLDAMQNAKPGSGKGKGKKDSFSLPDIIQQQNELMEKMKEGMQKQNQQGKPKEGEKGKEGKQGKSGKNGENEDLNGELYQIYKEQSELRQQLENAIKEGGDGNGQAKKALKQMHQLENEILEKGFNQNTLQRMQQLNYQLLKLDKATFEQGREKQRKSNTNLLQYNKNNVKALEFKKLFYNQTEILNRQSLPLRQNYKKKVQEYFSTPKTDK
ncbi:DUF4175 family protein [Tenacibaculum sp. IB213877]|uniref:DUF4175 family protein n=1 Tax=Tenacibaculum sp. IB213877 TaxID=3097351 RepID=UPI002A5AA534|nr:DUF4175 family protein [Tenacibaculum sp. IB213877]MDY0780483.1 DUF4175 family protein [Tenacibaculum sp. IB213877]